MTLVDSVFMMTSLNPFGTGQCLSTLTGMNMETQKIVSILLEQGNVFRQKISLMLGSSFSSQSFLNRAMSFDVRLDEHFTLFDLSQSFLNRAMSFDFAKANDKFEISRLNPF